MATRKEMYYLFEKSAGVGSVECGSVAFPSLLAACRDSWDRAG